MYNVTFLLGLIFYHPCLYTWWNVSMMTSSNGNIFRVTGPLREAGELRRYRAHYDVIAISTRTLAWFRIHDLRISETPFATKALKHIEAQQNDRHFADDISKCIFVNENIWIPIKVSLKCVPGDIINNIPALVKIMAWRRPGDKPSSEPMMATLPTHVCVTPPQWVKVRDALYGVYRL